MAIISVRNRKLDTAVSGVVGLEVVADHNKNRPVWAVFVMVRNKDLSNQRGAGLTTSERRAENAGRQIAMSASATQAERRVILLPLPIKKVA